MSYVIYNDQKYFVKENILKLNNCGIEDISKIEGLNSLSNLIELDLSQNNITEINSLERLISLQNLYLEGNKITEIKELEKLTSLQVLYLFSNKISEIKGLDTLTSLKTLILHNNEITEIKGLEVPTSLEELTLSSNKITVIQGFQTLANLKYLHLNKNKISEIRGLDPLESLEVLILSENEISEIKGLGELSKLIELYLDHNRITKLKGLENLSKLEKLNLEFNELKGEEEYIMSSGVNIRTILEYCENEKSILNELRYLDEYDIKIGFKKNLENFKNILSNEVKPAVFINIGTHSENKKIALMQNILFYVQEPELVHLNNKDKNLSKLTMNFIQLNSLKGVEFEKKDKIDHFLSFAYQFWSRKELKENKVLIYDTESAIYSKIDEFLKLSLLTKPKLIVFPENSIPYKILKKLKSFSKTHRILFICGMEHVKTDSNFINKVKIIDNGECDEQIKQTPVEIKIKDGNHLRENINCEIIPKIKIFKTTVGRIAIFICRDFLRLCDKIPEWAGKNNVDFIVIPSLTSKILPFHTKLLNMINHMSYARLKIIFCSIGEYGASEFFSIENLPRIEENFRKNIRDNIGEVIVKREYIFHSENIKYKDGHLEITCSKCGRKYTAFTNNRHLLNEDAFEFEKKKWEFNLSCKCGHKNYRY